MKHTWNLDSFESTNKYFELFKDEMVAIIRLKGSVYELAADLPLKEAFFTRVRLAGRLPEIRALLFLGAHSQLGEEEFARFDKALTDSPGGEMRLSREGHALLQFASLLQNLDLPVVVGVQGSVIGAYLGVLLAADHLVVSEDTVFSFGYTESTRAPLGALGFYLPRCVGVAKTKQILFSAKSLSAVDALEMGLVSAIVPKAEFQTRCIEIAGGFSRLSPSAVHYAKRITREIRNELEVFSQIQSAFLPSGVDSELRSDREKQQ